MKKYDPFKYIRDYYQVPVKRNARIKFQNKPGKITGTSGPHLKIKLDENPKNSLIVHPTWEMEYLNK